MGSNTFWPLMCIFALTGAATLLILSVLRVGAKADEANERYAEEMQRRAGQAEHE